MPIWRKLLQRALTSCPAALYMTILDIPARPLLGLLLKKKADQNSILKLRSFCVVERCQTKKSADPSALPEGEAQGKREALTALPACQLGPVRAPPHLWPARACSHGSVHRPPPLACCRFARVLEWLVPHDAAQGRYVNPTNACQSFQPHPSAFAFSGFEGAKRHRLCRPSGNPLGLNPAGVLLFRMRAPRRRWRL